MTDHPGRTYPERRVLDAIGCGDPIPPRTRPALLRRLVRDGLLQQHDPTPYRVHVVYEMTIPTHRQWCDHWAEKHERAEIKKKD